MNDLVYLKAMPDGTVEAFGDRESLNAPLEIGGGAGVCHKTVSAEDWARAGCSAYAANGSIVLGRRKQDVRLEQESAVRFARDIKLRACDKVSPMRWNAMTEVQKKAWTDYRQALLDIPQQEGFPWGGDPDAVPWPVKPE